MEKLWVAVPSKSHFTLDLWCHMSSSFSNHFCTSLRAWLWCSKIYIEWSSPWRFCNWAWAFLKLDYTWPNEVLFQFLRRSPHLWIHLIRLWAGSDTFWEHQLSLIILVHSALPTHIDSKRKGLVLLILLWKHHSVNRITRRWSKYVVEPWVTLSFRNNSAHFKFPTKQSSLSQINPFPSRWLL